MKIGIDARLLSRPITGMGRYTLEMCRALSRIEDVDLYLYAPSQMRNEYRSTLAVTNIKSGSWDNAFARQLWSETCLPLWAKQDGVDVFWGPVHRLPHYLSSSTARIVTIHDLVWKYTPDTMRPLSRALERYQMPFALRVADAVVAVSQATADALLNDFPSCSDRLSVIPLGSSEPNHISVDLMSQLNITYPYFLFVGTLEPRKNLDRLLTAYSELDVSIKRQAKLLIAGGNGWGKVNIADAISNLKLTNYVKLLGYVDEAMLSTLYANALFLAMPSLYEGFGLPIVEAMASGIPVLTANNSSMPEVAGDAGLFVDALDVGSIRSGLSQLIGNTELRNGLAAKAKKTAARFNWDDSARQMVRVFEKAILTRRGRSI